MEEDSFAVASNISSHYIMYDSMRCGQVYAALSHTQPTKEWLTPSASTGTSLGCLVNQEHETQETGGMYFDVQQRRDEESENHFWTLVLLPIPVSYI